MVYLGKQGENLATQIRFPFVNRFKKLYGEGVFQLIHKRNGDAVPYAVPISILGDSVIWDVRNTDVAFAGLGQCELIYRVNDVVAKSITYTTRTINALDDAGDQPPEPWASWVEEVLEAGARAEQAADNAEEYADDIKDLTVSSHPLSAGETPTVEKTGGDGTPYNLDFGIPTSGGKQYSSLRRLRSYLYEATFTDIPAFVPGNPTVPGGCSSFVQDGKLCRNLDFDYSEMPSFHVVCHGFDGMAFAPGLTDTALDDAVIGQLPYKIMDGSNDYNIRVSTHVLYNDWGWTGSGNTPLYKVPYIVLSTLKSIENIEQDLADILTDLTAYPALTENDYLLQFLITDGETTYALLPPESSSGAYVLQDISENPKLSNFRWVSDTAVIRADLQERPTGVERWNLMPCELSDLRFTKCYEQATRLSEFIGIDGTTKDSTDAELLTIYNRAHAAYLDRSRDGTLWQTMYSVVYGAKGMDHLWVQEDWEKDYIAHGGRGGASSWSEITGKPFKTLGETLTVDADGVLNIVIPPEYGRITYNGFELTVS